MYFYAGRLVLSELRCCSLAWQAPTGAVVGLSHARDEVLGTKYLFASLASAYKSNNKENYDGCHC